MARYMFAVAAFTADGKLIGGMVGDSTKPILASHPMPILMAWSYLSQVTAKSHTLKQSKILLISSFHTVSIHLLCSEKLKIYYTYVIIMLYSFLMP